MTEDRRKHCLNCAKRFSMEGNATLHCPDYSEDVTLRKAKLEQGAPAINKD